LHWDYWTVHSDAKAIIAVRNASAAKFTKKKERNVGEIERPPSTESLCFLLLWFCFYFLLSNFIYYHKKYHHYNNDKQYAESIMTKAYKPEIG
jgi:hypothetical protein